MMQPGQGFKTPKACLVIKDVGHCTKAKSLSRVLHAARHTYHV